jgi:hypothetical protein
MYDDKFNNVTGKYFVKTKETLTKKGSYDIDVRKKLWYISENLIRKV